MVITVDMVATVEVMVEDVRCLDPVLCWQSEPSSLLERPPSLR